MSSSSIANSTPLDIPECGCNKSMRMFISNFDENPKRRYWKCANLGGKSLISLFFLMISFSNSSNMEVDFRFPVHQCCFLFSCMILEMLFLLFTWIYCRQQEVVSCSYEMMKLIVILHMFVPMHMNPKIIWWIQKAKQHLVGKACDCNYSELVKDLTAIFEGLECKKIDKMNKSHNERNTLELYETLLTINKV
jgi:hypothetical protein